MNWKSFLTTAAIVLVTLAIFNRFAPAQLKMLVNG